MTSPQPPDAPLGLQLPQLGIQPAQLNPLVTTAPQVSAPQAPPFDLNSIMQSMALGQMYGGAPAIDPSTGLPVGQAPPTAQSTPAPQPQPQHHGGIGGLIGAVASKVGGAVGELGKGVQAVQNYTVNPLVGEVGNLITRPGEAGSFSAAQQRGAELTSGSGQPLPLRALIQTAANPLQAAITGAEVGGAIAGAPETGGLSLGLLAPALAQFGIGVGLTAGGDALMAHAQSIPGFNKLTAGEQQGLLMAAAALGSHYAPEAINAVGGADAVKEMLTPKQTAFAAYDEPPIGDVIHNLDQAQATVQTEPQPVPPVHDTTIEPERAATGEGSGPSGPSGGGNGEPPSSPPPGGSEEETKVPPPEQPPPQPGKVGPLPLINIKPQPMSIADKAMSMLRPIFHQTPYDPIGTPMARYQEVAVQRVKSLAANYQFQMLSRMRAAFGDNYIDRPSGDIKAPTIMLGEDGADKVPLADLMRSKLPLYLNRLTPEQVSALQWASSAMTSFTDQLRNLGVNIGNAPDLVPGGLYWPRGRADLEGEEEPMPQRQGRFGSKAGSEHHQVFETQQAGIDAGRVYAAGSDVMYSQVMKLGQHVIAQQMANYLKDAADEDGNPLGETPADRVPDSVRVPYQEAVRQAASLRGRINSAVSRARLNLGKADEMDKALESITMATPDNATQLAKLPDVLDAIQQQAEAMRAQAPDETMNPVTPDVQAASVLSVPAAVGDATAAAANQFSRALPPDIDRIATLETALRQSGSRLDQLRMRGENYSQVADDLQAQLDAVNSQLEQLKPAYQKAVEHSRQTPRGQSTINIPELSGYSFPNRLAQVINDNLTKGQRATGRMSGLVNTYQAANQLARGLKFAGAVAWMPIHGLIGIANTPFGNPAFAQAAIASFRSLADPYATGLSLADLDEKLAAEGLPTTLEGAAHGLHVGQDNEFLIMGKQGANENILEQAANRVGTLPVVKQANRMWESGTNVYRAAAWRVLVRQAARNGADLTDDKVLERIASAANRASGYSVNRMGGDIGDMALFAPRLLQAQIETVGAALKGVANFLRPGAEVAIDQRAAISDLMHLYGVMTGLSIGANYATGQKVPWDQFADPLSPEFLRFEWKGEHWSLFGPWDTLMRSTVALTTGGAGMANAIAHLNGTDFANNFNNIEFSARSASSPLTGMIWDAMAGSDLMGQKTTPGTMLRGILPMGIENLPGMPDRERVGWQGIVAQNVGVKNAPLTPTQQLNEIAQSSYGSSWANLKPTQQQAIKEKYPDLWQRKVNTMPQQIQAYYAKRSILDQQQQADDQALLAGKMSRSAWVNNYRNREQQLHGLSTDAFGAATLTPGKTPSQRYNNIVVENTNPDGTVNWQGVDSAVAQLSPSDQQWIADERTVGNTPVIQKYKQALQLTEKAGQISTLPGFSGIESGQVLATYYKALSYAATHFFSTTPSLILAGLASQAKDIAAGYQGTGIDGAKVVQGAMLYAMQALPYLPFQKREFELQNPLIGLFGLGSGTQGALSPAEVAQLSKA